MVVVAVAGVEGRRAGEGWVLYRLARTPKFAVSTFLAKSQIHSIIPSK